MKILYTTHYLKNRAGSELYTRDFVFALQERGHEVIVFCPLLGEISQQIEDRGIKVVSNIKEIEKKSFDIIHAQHNTTAILARSIFPNTPMIYLSHGVLPELEQPPSIDLGISKYIAVSEEVKENLIKKGIIEGDVEIIRNFVDISRYLSKKPVNTKLKNLLVISNHYTNDVRSVIEKGANKLDLNIVHIGRPNNSVEQVEDYINNSDIVISLGKGALNAMACERNVLVYDIHGSDGMVTIDNYKEVRKCNFSGRRFSRRYSIEDLEEELLKYDPARGKEMRDLILREHAIQHVVKKFENIYRFSIKHNQVKRSLIKRNQLFNEVSFLERQMSILEGVNTSKNQEIQKRDTLIQAKNQEIKKQDTLIQGKNQEIKKQDTLIQGKNQEIKKQERFIRRMQDSKFWKMRRIYLMVKNKFIFIFLNPRKFLRKYREKIQELFWHAYRSVHEEGLRIFLQRGYNYFRYGKGVLNKDSLYQKSPKNQEQDRYNQWMENIEKRDKEKVYSLAQEDIKGFSYKPKISIVLPVYNSDEIFLRKAIFSVIHQLYENWELCIVNDCSTKKIIPKIIKEFENRDKRIRILHLKKNAGISEATNRGVEFARGEFVGLLDHDDELVPETLLEYVRLLNRNKNLDFIYSDNDMIDIYGNRYNPKFKPDWSPEHLLSYAYTSHFKLYRRSLFLKVGGFKKEYDGSQDYEYNLRFTEETYKVGHVPKILYHWRAVPGSTATSASEKPLSVENGRRALDDALKRRGISGRAELSEVGKKRNVGMFKVKFDKEKYNEPVTIIIPTKDRADLLKQCISSIQEKTKYSNYKILVINNNSQEKETYEYLESQKDVEYFDIQTKKFNFAHINNVAIGKVKTELILFMNNDVEVISPDWLLEMVGSISLDEEIGAVGARLIYSDKRVQHAGVLLGLHDMSAGHANKLIPWNTGGYLNYNLVMRNYSAVTAACMLTKKSLFKSVGGFDEKNLAVAYNDVDYCLRLREKEYRMVYNPNALLYHHEGRTRGFVDNMEELKYFKKRWRDCIQKDPYYNPNLSLEDEQFHIKTQ